MLGIPKFAPAWAQRLTSRGGEPSVAKNLFCQEQHFCCGSFESKAGIDGGNPRSATRGFGNSLGTEIKRAADPLDWAPSRWAHRRGLGFGKPSEGPAFRVLYAPNGLDDLERATLEQVLLDLMQETTAGPPNGDPANDSRSMGRIST